MLPLFFQVILLDSASKAGGRLAIPALATPIGGLVAGFIMSRYGRLITLLRAGTLCMAFGTALVTSLGFSDSTWKYYLFIFPATLGQGITYPSTLFANIATFEHSGMSDHYQRATGHWLTCYRSCCLGVNSISDTQHGLRVGRRHYLSYRAERVEIEATGCSGRSKAQSGSKCRA